MALARRLLLPCVTVLSLSATAAEPVKIGLDHIPVAVRDLDAASATYRALGFPLKPGRPHANGIRNAHVKLPDGAGIGLLTVPAAVDPLVVAPERAHGLWLEFRPDVQPSKASASPVPPSFAVAVSEGEQLLPIARYRDGRWINTWPEPVDDSKEVPALAAVPTAWLGGPVPVEWTLWFAVGGSTRVKIAGTERTGGCVVSPKLRIHNPPVPPPGSFDEIHAGLATTDGVAAAAVEQIVSRAGSGTKSTDEALVRRLEPVVRSLFDAHQQKALERARQPDGAGTTLTPGQLANASLTIDWLYRSPGADPSLLYVEASKRPAPPPGERLNLHAWLRLAAGGDVVPLQVDAAVGWEEEAPDDESITGVPDQIPLGVITVGNRAVWFMERHYTESADFLLYEIDAAAVRNVLRVDGGGC